MPENDIILRCNAKINIGLHILGRRPADGYHLLETLFQEVDFGDELRIKSGHFPGEARFGMSCSNEEIPCDERNLVMKAAGAMAEFLPEDLCFRFHLEKKIPAGAGLGGGSSDAAAVLKYLNGFARLPERQLADMAVTLGADVPFFLRGGSAYAEGIGEKLKAVKIPRDWACVLVFPTVSVSTIWAYRELKIPLTDSMKSPIIPSYLGNAFKWRLFENDFEDVVIPAYPEIGDIKRTLQASPDIMYASLSGSGSTVFGVCESYEKAQELCKQFGNAVATVPI